LIVNGRTAAWRHVRELRGGFVFRPGAIAMGLAALAIGLTEGERRLTAVHAWSVALDWIFPPEPQAAYVVLGTIAGSMMTVVSVVYSILLVALTFASAQFSPRVLVTFVEDRVSQTTLGVFIGTFTFCLLTLPAVRGGNSPFVPSIAVVVAMGLAVACLACLLYFIHHIALSIQAGHIVDRIARETERTLDQVFPRPLVAAGARAATAPAEGGRPLVAEASGYIRSIDEAGLLAAAVAHDATLHVDRYIGQFIAAGTPILRVVAPGPTPAALGDACLRAFEVGATRTMEQDVEFGFLQIVDIALKAISPAVNDPTTATTCIDQLGRVLVRASALEPSPSALCDASGRARVMLLRTSFPRLLDVAFSQIRHYGKADVATPLRLMRVLGELAGVARDPTHAAAVVDQARRLATACGAGFPDDDRGELVARLAAVERTAGALAPGRAAADGTGPGDGDG